MAGAGISYKIEYLRINRTCPASTCSIFHTLYEPKFQVALTHRNWTGGLLPVNASSYILGASIQPLAWLCVGCSGLVRVYQACAVFPMDVLENPTASLGATSQGGAAEYLSCIQFEKLLLVDLNDARRVERRSALQNMRRDNRGPLLLRCLCREGGQGCAQISLRNHTCACLSFSNCSLF